MEHSLPAKYSAKSQSNTRPMLFRSACAAVLAGAMMLGGGGAPAFADGYVSGDNNNLYYGYKTDAGYSAIHLLTEVQFYDTAEDAHKGDASKQNPMGRYVRVHYYSNDPEDVAAQPDFWALRPSWWFGVPKGLENVQHIKLIRKERTTHSGSVQVKHPEVVGGKDRRGFTVVTAHEYARPSDFDGISRSHYSQNDRLNSSKAQKTWDTLVGFTKYDNAGNTKDQWPRFQNNTQSIFVDWESAGARSYDFTYIARISDKVAQDRVNNPLYFTAGVHRPVGNWHYATGRAYYAPRAADNIKIKYPPLTEVANTAQLTGEENALVVKAIKDANARNADFGKYLRPADGITVNADGSAKITFADGSSVQIPSVMLVKQGQKMAEKYRPQPAKKTGVIKLDALTPDEKKQVKEALVAANKKDGAENDFLKHLQKNGTDYAIEVENNGDAQITFADGSKITVPASELVYQGETIADWAPYGVPDPIEVENPQALKPDEITKVIAAFDEANKDLSIYQDSKKEGKSPVEFKDGNAVITWKDGSLTTVPGYLFLKKKAADVPQQPKPPVQTDKQFKVTPKSPTAVNFDPFHPKPGDLDANKTQIDALKSALKNYSAVDTADGTTPVTITGVDFDFDNGKVVFHADGYKDSSYPMGLFLKQKPDKQTPKETEHTPAGTNYKYRVTPVEREGNTPSMPEQVKALKSFIKSNYGIDLTNDLTVADSYSLPENAQAVPGTSGMNVFKKGTHDDAGVTTINIAGDGSLTVQGYEKGNPNPKQLFTVPVSELYVKKGAPTDHTVSDLKDLAKKLVKSKKAEGVTASDFEKAGVPATDDNTINKMDEQALRDFIKKVSDARHIEEPRRYKTDPLPVEDLSAAGDSFAAAVQKFIAANYDGANVTVTGNEVKLVTKEGSGELKNVYNLTPKADTSGMKTASADNPKGIASIKKSSDGKGADVCDPEGKVLFSLSQAELYSQSEKPMPADQLQKMKDEAKKAIERNPKLTKEQKADFAKQIDDADTPQKVREILQKANEQAGQNNVSSEDLKKKQQEEEQKAQEAARKKAEEEAKQKAEEQTRKDKANAENTIGTLDNLSDGENQELKKKLNGDGAGNEGAKTPAEVQQILDEAKARDAAHAAEKKLVFLDHGKGAQSEAADPNHKEDAALDELLHREESKQNQALKNLENLLKPNSGATAAQIDAAVEEAKRANGENELTAKQNAKAELAALPQLTEEQRKAAEEKINSATAPSQIKKALDDARTQDAKNRSDGENQRAEQNKAQAEADKQALEQEKKQAKEDLDKIPDLTEEEKKAAVEEIDHATKKGDAPAVVNRAKKQKKIRAVLKEISGLEHLNNRQKATFESIIKQSDGTNKTDENSRPTDRDDIDDALDQALKLNGAMKRLQDLDGIANTFRNGEKYKALDAGHPDQKAKKDAFDSAFGRTDSAADPNQPGVLNKEKGDDLGFDQVNELYRELLEAMKAIDPAVQGAGLYTEDLQKEYDADAKLKADKDPKYENASENVKLAFDTALNNAKSALDEAKKAGAATDQAAQDKVTDAYVQLVKARQALDGVDTAGLKALVDEAPGVKADTVFTKSKEDLRRAYEQAVADGAALLTRKGVTEKEVQSAIAKINAAKAALNGVDTAGLQEEVGKKDGITGSDKYQNASADKKAEYDRALAEANNALAEAADTNSGKTAREKQQRVNAALERLRQAENALDGKASVPAPAPAPAPTPVPAHRLARSGSNASLAGLLASVMALAGAAAAAFGRRRGERK